MPHVEGKTFGFMLVIRKSDGVALANKDERQISIGAEGSEYVLGALDSASINEAMWLRVRGSGFASEDDAKSAGRALRRALSLAAFQMRFGIDPGRGARLSGSGKVVKDFAEESGYRLLDGIHGLQVFPEDMPTRMLWSGPIKVTVGKKGFADAVAAALKDRDGDSDRGLLALDLYNGAHFEHSLRARFIQWATCVECIAEQRYESDGAVSVVESLLASIRKEDVPDDVKVYLAGRLGRLKKESISRACQRTVHESLGKPAADRFLRAYDLRSAMVHDGLVVPDEDLREVRLDELVRKLLTKELRVG